MADAKRQRPLSPHLQVYRWPATMATSITHRATGIANYVGAAFLTWFLVALAIGPEAYEVFRFVASSWMGIFVLIGYTWSLIYHLLNGIRHLHWDAGSSLDNDKAERSSIFVIIASLVCTALFWLALV